MTALILQWRRPDPPVVVRWRGPDGVMLRGATDAPPTLIAAIIGPPGPAGPVGGVITRTAGEAIGGHRAVTIGADGKAYLASPVEPQAMAVFGVTTGAAAVGAPVTIQCAGALSEASWNWTSGPVWLGAAGALTQIVPTVGAAVHVGTAGGPTTLTIAPRIVARL